jgi:virginiamycin A acetyltransferase
MKIFFVDETTSINGNCLLKGFKEAPIYIGKYCAIAENLRIRLRNHSLNYPNVQRLFQRRYKFKSIEEYKGCVTIGNACWIGDNVVILPGVKIGNAAVIGAGAFVTKDIPDFAIVGGVPAKFIKFRFNDEIVSFLNDIKWWDRGEDKIRNSKDFFETDLSVVDVDSLKGIIK